LTILNRWRNHIEEQFSSVHNIVLRDIWFCIKLAIQANRANVTILVTNFRSFNRKGSSILQINFHVRKIRSSKNILVSSRANGIKAHCWKDIPCRHLSTVVIAAKSVNIVTVHFVHNFTNPVLTFPGLWSPRIEIRNMMARFVALHITAKHSFTRYIFCIRKKLIRNMHCKECIQTGNKAFVSSHDMNQAVHIMRNIKRIIPAVAFHETLIACLQKIKRFPPLSISESRLSKSRCRIKYFLITHGTSTILICSFQVAKS